MLAVPHCKMPCWWYVFNKLVDSSKIPYCMKPAAIVLAVLHYRHESQGYKKALHLAFHPSSFLVSLLPWVVIVQ